MPSSIEGLSYTLVGFRIFSCTLIRSNLTSLSAGFGKGTADGIVGDHILLSPPLSISSEEVQLIIQAVKAGIDDVFAMDRVQQAIQEVSELA